VNASITCRRLFSSPLIKTYRQHTRMCVRYLSDLSYNSGWFYDILQRCVRCKTTNRRKERILSRELDSRGAIFFGVCLLFFLFVLSFLRVFRFSSSTPVHVDITIRLVRARLQRPRRSRRDSLFGLLLRASRSWHE